MLSGTETSLTYEIDINFTNKPQNLKLYIDEGMQNELYIENDVLSLKDFLSLEDEKEVSKIIYWNWAEETGDTEEEIHENDLKDSEFMGKKLQMAISVTGKQAMSANNNHYMVTLDANGGKIGSSASVQKQVTGGEAYGELPVPTREGYTFMGWNGKNIIDKSQSSKTEIQNETPLSAWASTSFNTNWVINNLKPNTQYSISYDIEGVIVPEYDSKYSGNLGFILRTNTSDFATYPTIYLMSGDGYFINVGEKIHFERTFTTPAIVDLAESEYEINSYTNRYIKDGVGVYSSVIFSKLQLEEGSIPTVYEPYYITSSTEVVQNKNHILTAIWKKN